MQCRAVVPYPAQLPSPASFSTAKNDSSSCVAHWAAAQAKEEAAQLNKEILYKKNVTSKNME